MGLPIFVFPFRQVSHRGVHAYYRRRFSSRTFSFLPAALRRAAHRSQAPRTAAVGKHRLYVVTSVRFRFG